jgi:ubiquinol-cytochrome c reductase cytochrome c subunit
MKKIVSLAAILILPVWIALAQAPGNAENGKKLFLRNGCYECHGTVGQGGVGPRLAPRPMPAVALTAFVRKPSGNMPPYSAKVMPDSDVADVRAYLASIPDPPPVQSIPILRP